MNGGKAEEIRIAICAQFPNAKVAVTPQPDGADIVVVNPDDDQVRRYKIDDDDLNSPIVRLLVGAVI